jgi:hypothetical protein
MLIKNFIGWLRNDKLKVAAQKRNIMDTIDSLEYDFSRLGQYRDEESLRQSLSQCPDTSRIEELESEKEEIRGKISRLYKLYNSL